MRRQQSDPGDRADQPPRALPVPLHRDERWPWLCCVLPSPCLLTMITVYRCDALSSRDPGCPGQARLPRGGKGGKPRRVGGEPLESGQNEDQRHQNIVQGVSRRQMLILILRPKLNIVNKTSTKLLAFHAHQFQVMTTGRKRSAIVVLLLC